MSNGAVSLSSIRQFYGDVSWIWPDWIPRGHVTLIAGPQEVGKTCLAIHLAAVLCGHVTAWPDGCPVDGLTPGPVIIADTEEVRGQWAQRLIALGVGDGDVLFPSPDGSPTYIVRLPRDVPLLERLAREHHCSAVVVDSLSGGHALDENSAAMRSVLQSLVGLAGRTQLPVIAIHHVRKRGAFESVHLTLDRVRGHTAISQFCRSIIGIYRLEEDATVSRVAALKSNFCQRPEPFGFTITDDGLVFCEAPEEEERSMTAIDRAAEFLRVELRREPQRYSVLLSKAEQEGISHASLYRAKERLRIRSIDGVWTFSQQ